MSSSFFMLLFLSFSIFFSIHIFSLPIPLLIPIEKDPITLQHTTTISQGTPLTTIKLLFDLGSSFSWIDCSNKNPNSTSYRPIPCNSSLCKSLNYFSLPCSSNHTCSLFPENPLTRKATIAESFRDSLSLPTTNGRNPGQLALISDFIFSCSSQPQLLLGLPEGVSGLLALGRSNFSLPAQVSNAFTLPYLFTLCLSSSPSAPGVAFFGTRGPYVFHPETDLSNSLIHTPLLLNPVSNTVITYNGRPSDEYFIGVRTVKVNGKPVKLNGKLLTVDENGFGGTKISTVLPYTTMETSIYKAFTEAFTREAAKLNLRVTKNPVKPFSVCFSLDDVGSTRVGPAVPTVDFVMEKDDVYWRMFGVNLMVRMVGDEEEDHMWCLGFVDGGTNPRTSIVIGGHQMEDNLLQFDLRLKRFGFSSSLLIKQTSCGNFNFTIESNLNW
ncbi:Peptidase A1 [Macleaya cordata]|uniref:Peptidase A1 n=1 Tax=Macleaya cordata TaxID=56857 RepID=A0A200PXL3_MACCD|nr:Peptidase A1 [Macleaya cordata]